MNDLFKNDSSLISEAEGICGGLDDKQCLYDFAQTKDEEAAQASQTFNADFQEQQVLLCESL